MQLNIFVLLSMLYASTQVGAQLENWTCDCNIDGVEALHATSQCCNLVEGTLEVADFVGLQYLALQPWTRIISLQECHILGDINPDDGPVGVFQQCCSELDQGSGCAPSPL
jgi:hypothetical protein